MFLSGINTLFERGKCLQVQAQASAGNTLLPFQSSGVAQLFHLLPFFPTPPHSNWLFKALHTYFLLAAASRFFEFPIWSALPATPLHCAVCSCHLLSSRRSAESWSRKMRLRPCLSSSWKLVSSKYLPDTSGDEPLLPLPRDLSKTKK